MNAPPSNLSLVFKDGAENQASGLVAEDLAGETGETPWLCGLTAVAREV
jgi:hypothetical protein